MEVKNSATIIGISGVTCGGKTTVTEKLKQIISKSYKVKTINQDDYYKEENEIEIDENGFVKWDCVGAVNFDQLFNDVHSAISLYDVIIVEGILIFAHEKLNELFQLRIFLDLNYEEASLRRSRRSYDPPDVEGLFDNHVWPEYLNYKKLLSTSTGNFPNLTHIDASLSLDKVFHIITQEVQTTLNLLTL